MHGIRYRKVPVNGINVFYRGAGTANSMKLLLLHGFPSAGHMFRDLIPQLADRFHIVAPDLPGFGQSDMPSRNDFKYTFANISHVIDDFTDSIRFDRYAVYVFDYGAPVGFRLAVKNPEKINAIISQNGNAYVEGLSDGWNPIRAYWKDNSQVNREALRGFLAPETTVWQYTQLDLFGDYQSNVALYPKFQEYFRAHRPRLLAAWGKNDPFFLPSGAEAFKGDIPEATVRFFDTGHFALETHATEIAVEIRKFLT